MNTNTPAGRLEALKRSFEAARDCGHPTANPYIKGLNDGLQLAIEAIDVELRMIGAGEAAVAALWAEREVIPA